MGIKQKEDKKEPQYEDHYENLPKVQKVDAIQNKKRKRTFDAMTDEKQQSLDKLLKARKKKGYT